MKKAWNDPDILNPKFLGSWDVPENSTLKLKIKSAQKEDVDNFRTNSKESKLVVYFEGNWKPMVINITNAKAISMALKSKYLEDWLGKYVEIGTKKIRAFGEDTWCLRIKQDAPVITEPQKENLTPEHPKWEAGINALKEGKTTIEAIKKTYILTPENEQLLCENLK